MKKIFITRFSAMLMAMTLIFLSHAQVVKIKPDGLSQNKNEKIKFLGINSDINEDFTPVYYTEINTRTLRNFIRSFGNSTDVKWYKTEEGSVAYFTEDSIKTRAFYSKGGNYLSMLRQYYENRLSKDIRSLLKNKYADFSIYYVNEVNADGITLYFVKIENETSWRTIRIVDMEMEIVETVLKESTNARDNNNL